MDEERDPQVEDVTEAEIEEETPTTASIPLTQADIEIEKRQVRSWDRIVKYIVGIIVVASISALAVGAYLISEQVKYRDQQVDYLIHALSEVQEEKDEIQTFLQVVYERCAAASDCNVGDVPSPEEIEGDTSPLPSPGVSQVDIALAVTQYCADGSCSVPVSEEDIQEAVARYCVDGACVGPPGETGQAGPPGETGQAGPPGSVPTPEEIAEAVASYCAGSLCTGPQGDPGESGAPGVPGQDGRGIQTLVCDTSGNWQVTYTDGETREAGTCRVESAPEATLNPTETPVPTE